jgi:succinate dehydrogenase subunit C
MMTVKDAPGAPAGYTEFHPRWYRRKMPVFWWVRRRSYLAFVARELSSVFVAWFVVFLLLLIRAVGQGDAAYQRFLDWAANPFIIALNVLALGFVVFHAITWFNLAPQALVVRMRGERIPPRMIAGGNYLAWVVASAIVIWIVLA